MRTIKLMTDYGCFPIWDCDNGRNLNPEDLPISTSLKQDLKKWAETFDAILDWDDPASAGFKSDREEQEFEEKGLELWQRLENEIGDEYIVEYFSTIQSKVLVNRPIECWLTDKTYAVAYW